ncbi:MAG: gliding motility protein GldM [Bacteroidia bacterium]|jgi:gliding motility-associated protein GldM
MASGQQSPRQKMINMMYLVLTAMLALNVSAEILKAFAMINQSLEDTNVSIAQKNAALYAAFDAKMREEPGKTEASFKKAQQVKKESETLLNYITDLKNHLIDLGGNKNGEVDEGDFKEQQGVRSVIEDGNIDISSHVLVNPDGKSERGLELMNMINTYRNNVIAQIPAEDRAKVKIYVEEAKDPEPAAGTGVRKNWLQSNFGDMPLSGVITLFSKYESDIRNTETEVISYLLGAIDASSLKFDQVIAKVIPKSNYVLVGQEYEADIMLVAFDSRQDLDIRLEDGTKVPVEGGLGRYKMKVTSEGSKTLAGFINVNKPGGGVDQMRFETSYTVAKPAAVVSPDKMNVFYIGVENPVSISAPGVTPSNLRPSISGGGSITGKDGKYVVKVTQPGKVMVDVRGQGEEGKPAQLLGASEFRVKYVPDPLATVGGLDPGQVGTAQFKAQGGMIALLKDFDFDLRFDIQSFRMIYIAPRRDPEVVTVSGPIFTGQAQTIIRNAKPGDRFIFDEIKAMGPDKVTRKLPAATYGLN